MYKKALLSNNKSGDIMINEFMNRKIIFADINDSFKKVSYLMKKNNIGFIPIKDNNKYIGVITDRDICLSLPNINNINDSIKSYITNNIIYIDVNSKIEDALEKFGKYKVKRLLVKDKDDIIGILSLSDILNHFNDEYLIKTIKNIFYIHDNNKNNENEIDDFYL